mgnify:FL=1
MSKLYLAYGSNLNVRQMKFRCPTAKIIGVGVIKNYELLYKGSKTGSYLTIEPQKGSYVPVGVWEVTAEDEAKLDLYEGFPKFYYKKSVRLPVEFFDGKGTAEKTAFVYIMHEERPLGVPTGYYIQVCRQGYYDFGFDMRLIYEACQKSLKGVNKA